MLHLTPRVHTRVKNFLADSTRIKELARGLGSPLNLLFPACATENADAFLHVLKEEGLKGRIFFAHKPNKSEAIIKQLSLKTIGIDVASHDELVSALRGGFTGNHLEATGPKSAKFLRLALQHGVIIAVDSMDELLLIESLMRHLTCPKAQILLRVCNFSSTHTKIQAKDTRFGVDIKKIETYYRWLRERTQIELIGLSFHLNAANAQEKMIAIEHSLTALTQAASYGLSPTVLNIGGGFRVSYLESSTEWDDYQSALKKSVIDGGEPMSWDGSGLGYRNEKGTLQGAPQFADSYISQTPANELRTILHCALPTFNNTSFKQVLEDFGFELWIEPGRAMLDQVGITVGRVLSVKQSAKGEHVVVLDMNRSHLNSQDLIVLSDPTIIYQTPKEQTENIGVYFAGNLCLKSDLLTRHKTFLPQLPEPDDLVVFHNTAAYMMDFAESHTLQQPVAKKVAITEKNNVFSWSLDELYEPL
jgi:diaminopimelate decarboxylase